MTPFLWLTVGTLLHVAHAPRLDAASQVCQRWRIEVVNRSITELQVFVQLDSQLTWIGRVEAAEVENADEARLAGRVIDPSESRPRPARFSLPDASAPVVWVAVNPAASFIPPPDWVARAGPGKRMEFRREEQRTRMMSRLLQVKFSCEVK